MCYFKRFGNFLFLKVFLYIQHIGSDGYLPRSSRTAVLKQNILEQKFGKKMDVTASLGRLRTIELQRFTWTIIQVDRLEAPFVAIQRCNAPALRCDPNIINNKDRLFFS